MTGVERDVKVVLAWQPVIDNPLQDAFQQPLHRFLHHLTIVEIVAHLGASLFVQADAKLIRNWMKEAVIEINPHHTLGGIAPDQRALIVD
jgi:hypothetical protein